MSFERKLKQLVDDGLALERALGAAIRDVGRAVADVLATQRASDFARVSDQVGEAKDTCATYDAALYIQEKVFEGHNGAIHDLRCRRDFRALQADIDRLFEEGVPTRGFVYVAWSLSPERYVYVGKAGSPDRLQLAGHGKLAHGLTSATRLSLVFPSQSREDVLLGLEASVIELIAHATGAQPKLNDQNCPVPTATGQQMLDEVARFLEGIAKHLKEC